MKLRSFPPDYAPIQMALEPKSDANREKLLTVLRDLATRLEFQISRELVDHIRIHLNSELHGKIVMEELRKAAISVFAGQLQTSYRETFATTVEIDFTHKRVISPAGQFARVKLRFEPNNDATTNAFENRASDDAVPSEYLAAVERGIHAVIDSGPLLGFPVIACRTILLDGAYHDVESSPFAFEMASRGAFRDPAVEKAMVLLEPVWKIWVVTPEAWIGSVIGDINSRRGIIQGKTEKSAAIVVEAFVPVANMFGYRQDLATLTQNSAAWTWEAAGLAEAPSNDDPPFRSAMAMRA